MEQVILPRKVEHFQEMEDSQVVVSGYTVYDLGRFLFAEGKNFKVH